MYIYMHIHYIHNDILEYAPFIGKIYIEFILWKIVHKNSNAKYQVHREEKFMM